MHQLQHSAGLPLSRGAALINLATDLPAPVLADILGMHVNTAVRWVRHAKRDWASYLVARAGNQTAAASRDSAVPRIQRAGHA